MVRGVPVCRTLEDRGVPRVVQGVVYREEYIPSMVGGTIPSMIPSLPTILGDLSSQHDSLSLLGFPGGLFLHDSLLNVPRGRHTGRYTRVVYTPQGKREKPLRRVVPPS